MALLESTYTWYILSFIVFAVIILKYGVPAINTLLDARIQQIKDDLEKSESLRVEAQEMLAQYQRKHRDALQESEEIINAAKDNASRITENAELHLSELMVRKEAQLNDRLQRMQDNAMADIQNYASDLALKTAEILIRDELHKKNHASLIDQSISQVQEKIH